MFMMESSNRNTNHAHIIKYRHSLKALEDKMQNAEMVSVFPPRPKMSIWHVANLQFKKHKTTIRALHKPPELNA